MIYNYLFYTYYRFWEKAPSRWWSEWKAILTICFLKVFLLTSISNIIMFKSKLNLVPTTRLLPIVLAIFIFGFNYYLFLHKEKWQTKIRPFKGINRKSDLYGILAVIFITGLTIAALIYSYYLLSIVGWENV